VGILSVSFRNQLTKQGKKGGGRESCGREEEKKEKKEDVSI